MAIAMPVIASLLAWVWTDLTLSRVACAHDDRGGVSVLAGLIILIVLAPAATAWRTSRHGASAARTAAVILGSALLAALLVWAAYLVWWFGHGCYD